MDIDAFLNADKSLVIAPAGYGKTYAIAEAIASYQGHKKVLVLTHTHAGIASLKEKFDQRELLPSKYHLDTICSYALELAKTYHINKEEIPSESDTSAMFSFAIHHAKRILQSKPIRHLMGINYEHLIVDEYQDCTVAQHQMIMELAKTLKTHILADPLQGIFGFGNEQIVDFNDGTFEAFFANSQTLDIPWRWQNAGKESLGRDLSAIRNKLLNKEDVNLGDYPSVECCIEPADGYTQPGSQYKRKIFEAINDDSVLLIHPISQNPQARVKFIQQFPQLRMIESIDDKSFYEYCDLFDSMEGEGLVKTVVDMMKTLAKTSAITKWFNIQGKIIKKQKQTEKEVSDSLVNAITPLLSNKTFSGVLNLIDAISGLPDMRIYRKSLLFDVKCTLRDAERLGITAKEAIIRNRNIVRRKGRKIIGKSIGTTLLTKGLEFDTVVVLNAHQFDNPKHLYVALTRCCSRLVVITNNPVLHPYSE